MEDLKKILKLVLLTGNVKNTKPVSLLIVSKSGNGKTELITSYKKKSVAFITDLSAMGLLDLLEKEPHIKHLIIPDFIKITQKKRATSDNLISLLNALVEEGIGRIKIFNHTADFQGKTIGLITATTKASYAQKKNIWDSFGFVQRMIIVSYDYADNTIEEIMESINKEEFIRNMSEKLVTIGKEVISERNLNKQLNKYVNKNFRTLKHLQSLCKANAVLRGDKRVSQQDVDEIIRLTKFMNLNYTKI